MWISLSRQESRSRRDPVMPTAATQPTIIPPPGPPARPGVLKFFPPYPSDPAQSSTGASTATATTARWYSPACLRNSVVSVPAQIGEPDAGNNNAALRKSSSAGSQNTKEEEERHKRKIAVTPEALEGLPVTPPSRFKRFASFIWGSKKDRRKPSEKKKSCKEKQNDHREIRRKIVPSAPQLPIEINGNNRGPTSAFSSWRSPSAWDPPDHQPTGTASSLPQGSPWHQNSPARRSFRLSGHMSDLSGERNMLPLWLEEGTRVEIHQSKSGAAVDKNGDPHYDHSFDSRWNSLTNRQKRQPDVPTVRPPGWEDIEQHERSKRTKSYKGNSNFCPSFTINDISTENHYHEMTPDAQHSTSPITVCIEPPPTKNQAYQGSAFDMGDLSTDIDNILSRSFTHDQQRQFSSTSNLAPQSASNTPSRTPSQASGSAIADRHLWASSDSFICEDFSFCRGKSVDESQMASRHSQSPPRSYSQVILRQSQFKKEHANYEESLVGRERSLQDMVDFGAPFEQEKHEETYMDTNSMDLQNFRSDDGDPDRFSQVNGDDLEDGYFDVLDEYNTTEATTSYEDPACLESSSCTTIRVTDNQSRREWIRFEHDSLERLDGIVNGDVDPYEASLQLEDSNFEFEHQSNFGIYRKDSEESPASPTSPVLSNNCSGSTLNLVEPRIEQKPEIYRGQFVRSYSIRGRRASKRVTRTVSQRMNPPEYGKLTEPVPPMYSRAVLTMTSGPGLFEQDDSQNEDVLSSIAESENRDNTKPNPCTSTTGVSKSKLSSPGLPNRAGSLRVPHLPSIFLRRSVSLNAPKVSRGEIPFQRLPERRESFKKAISGIGAIARNFRKRSGSMQTSASALSHITEVTSNDGTPSRLQRSGSTGSSIIRPTPKAPRLPRRAISHKQNGGI